MARVLDSVTLPIKKNGTKTNQNYVNNPKSTAGQFSTSTAYAVGQYVYYDKKLYRFTTAHAAGAWNASHVTEVTVTSELASLKAETNDLKQDYNQLSETKADKNSYNPEMGAGYAAQLVSGLKKSDQTPYNFRKVPYDATLEDGSIVGASVAWNQLINPDEYGAVTSYDTWTKTGSKVTANGTPSSNAIYKFSDQSRMVTGHKYYLKGCPKNGGSDKWYIRVTGSNNYYYYGSGIVFSYGNEPSSSEYIRAYVVSGVTANNLVFEPMLFDLTQMLGTTIADYVYGLETATAGSGVAWLKEHFPKQFDSGYQAYNAGEIKSISGLSSHKSVGFNQWDEEWELGSISSSDGSLVPSATRIRSKNKIPVLPLNYYFYNGSTSASIYVFAYDANDNLIDYWIRSNQGQTFPSGTAYIRISPNDAYGTTYKNDICINLSKPTGTPKNGDYVPYESHTYALDSTQTLRGILKLDSNNKLYADGDVYKADGTVERRYGVVDMGTLSWSYRSQNNLFYANMTPYGFRLVSTGTGGSYICKKYNQHNVGYPNMVNGDISNISSGLDGSKAMILVCDTSYTSAQDFTTAMSGVYLVYELDTPTTETALPYGNPQVINPDGTESYVYTDGAFELPVGHTSEYPVNVAKQLDDILDTPTTNGTYTLQATVTDGVVAYEWVSAT